MNMKYRIVKITPTEDKPYYKIEVRKSFLFSVEWVSMSTRGYPMAMGIYSMSQAQVSPFKSLEKAREYLDAIVNYKPPTEEVVFKT